MKIAVAGTGYVGLSLATLLSQENEVIALDVIPEKVEKINNRISPIKDKEIEDFFKTKDLNLKATLDYKEAFEGAKFIIISTPTNYDDEKNHFDTSSVEDIIQKSNQHEYKHNNGSKINNTSWFYKSNETKIQYRQYNVQP